MVAATGPYMPRFLAMKGQGIGSALLANRLTELHRSVPTYLEATNRRNLALFLHHGFTVTATVHIPDVGPTLYRMWREARAR